MILLITGNNDTIVTLYTKSLNTTIQLTNRYHFDIYNLSDKDIVDYTDTNKFVFSVHNINNIPDITNSIYKTIEELNAVITSLDKDDQDELVVITAFEEDLIDTQITKLLISDLNDSDMDLSVQSAYKLFKLSGYSDLMTNVKRVLGIPDDTDITDCISFTYALYQVLSLGR